MKDPLDSEERPYEVLGIAPDTSIPAVQKAYSSFLMDRKNMARRPAAAIARDRMSRLDRRLQDEMLYYPSGSSGITDLRKGEASEFTHEVVPPKLELDIDTMISRWTLDEDEYDQLGERRVQFASISTYEEGLLSCLPIDFPK